MGEVAPAVAACAGGAHGLVSVRLMFDGSGAVTSATINPTYPYASREPGPECEPTPDSSGYYSCSRSRPPQPGLDECVLRAARGARLPPFERPSFSVNFPFRY